MEKIIGIAFQKKIVLSSLKVAIIVGIILNLINQFDAIISFDIKAIHWLKLLLTFCVPYLVSTYASVVTSLRGQ